ncbi:type 1 fimbrial protein [Hafnia paralvei]|uniref:fimbrial protein n=1 Tax=Hafnia paralvei TaxID=546367 RepID=UPI00103366A5|nr:fimbrial protein [Hafnia paralvei]TBM10887.1 type 1 fimbrial protein [Hafnia paralvei]
MFIRSWLYIAIGVIPILAHAQTGNITPGSLSMKGELIEAACVIDPLYREQWIEFGNISARDIAQGSGVLLTKNFNIKLTGCSLASVIKPGSYYHSANVTFTGIPDSSDNQLLAIDGEARGFAIQLADTHGEILTLGKNTPDYALMDGDNILNFSASLVSTGRNIRAGDFYATARFFMDYL